MPAVSNRRDVDHGANETGCSGFARSSQWTFWKPIDVFEIVTDSPTLTVTLSGEYTFPGPVPTDWSFPSAGTTASAKPARAVKTSSDLLPTTPTTPPP